MRTPVLVKSGVAVSICLAALLGGCTTNPNQQSLEQAVNSYREDLWEATEQYIQTCMAEQGFTYHKQPHESAQIAMSDSLSPFVLTEAEAAANGFGIVDETVAAALNNETSALPPPVGTVPTETQSTEYEAALYGYGMDGSGCQFRGRQQANESIDPNDYPAIANRIQVVERIMADPRYTAFWASWSQCMAQQGIIASDTDALEGDFVDRAARLVTMQDPVFDPVTGQMISPPTQVVDMAGAESLEQQEIVAAVASVQCLEPLKNQWESIVNDAQK